MGGPKVHCEWCSSLKVMMAQRPPAWELGIHDRDLFLADFGSFAKSKKIVACKKATHFWKVWAHKIFNSICAKSSRNQEIPTVDTF